MSHVHCLAKWIHIEIAYKNSSVVAFFDLNPSNVGRKQVCLVRLIVLVIIPSIDYVNGS